SPIRLQASSHSGLVATIRALNRHGPSKRLVVDFGFQQLGVLLLGELLAFEQLFPLLQIPDETLDNLFRILDTTLGGIFSRLLDLGLHEFFATLFECIGYLNEVDALFPRQLSYV